MTKREQILQAIKTTLSAATSVAAASIYRTRVTALTRGRTPAISIEAQSDAPSEVSLGNYDWNLSVDVSVIVRSDNPDQVSDPIVQEVHTLMMQDRSFGGLTMDCQPGVLEFEFYDTDTTTGVVSMQFLIKYRTVSTDLST